VLNAVEPDPRRRVIHDRASLQPLRLQERWSVVFVGLLLLRLLFQLRLRQTSEVTIRPLCPLLFQLRLRLNV